MNGTIVGGICAPAWLSPRTLLVLFAISLLMFFLEVPLETKLWIRGNRFIYSDRNAAGTTPGSQNVSGDHTTSTNDTITALPNYLIGSPSPKLACKYPILDPWDPSIKDWFVHPKQITCAPFQPWFSYVNRANQVVFNRTEFMLYGTDIDAESDKSDGISCKYRDVYTKGDFKLIYSQPKEADLSRPIEFTKNTLEVACYDANETEIYNNLHNVPVKIPKERLKPTSENQLSVVLFVLESVSRGMARRNLPRTYEYLTEEMNAFDLRGYNKMGENSFPNFIAIMSGRRVQDYDTYMPNEGGDYKKVPFDGWNFLWKQFSRHRGYITGYMEDWANFGTFTWGKPGFSKPPTDWYYRPFFMARDKSWVYGKTYRKHCFGNYPSIKEHFDVTRRVMMQHSRDRYFFVNFLTDLSHDSSVDIESGDVDLRNMLHDAHWGGYLNNTVMIVLGDHGSRTTALRNTYVGSLEVNLAFVTITFPPWFYQKHPHIQEALATNQWRLTTNFDLYETLVDIKEGRYDHFQRPRSHRGQSLLYEIPLDRTCIDAGIPSYYCTCHNTTKIPVNDTKVVKAAATIVKYVNSITEPYRNMCAILELQSISRAQVTNYEKGILEKIKLSNSCEYKLSIQLKPGGGIFEAVVVYEKDKDNFKPPQSVSRLNLYGNTSACMKDNTKLRPICYCLANMKRTGYSASTTPATPTTISKTVTTTHAKLTTKGTTPLKVQSSQTPSTTEPTTTQKPSQPTTRRTGSSVSN